jgi:hypothetical protein
MTARLLNFWGFYPEKKKKLFPDHWISLWICAVAADLRCRSLGSRLSADSLRNQEAPPIHVSNKSFVFDVVSDCCWLTYYLTLGWRRESCRCNVRLGLSSVSASSRRTVKKQSIVKECDSLLGKEIFVFGLKSRRFSKIGLWSTSGQHSMESRYCVESNLRSKWLCIMNGLSYMSSKRNW